MGFFDTAAGQNAIERIASSLEEISFQLKKLNEKLEQTKEDK